MVSVPDDRGKQAFVVALLAIAAVGLALRLYNLAALPYWYDEGAHALKVWEVLQTGAYDYDPNFHGPLLYFIGPIWFALAGESIFAGRLLNVVLSMGVFPALYLLRNQLPRPALLAGGALLATHPIILRSVRFWKNDTMLVSFALLAVAGYALYRQRPTRRNAVFFGALVALTVTSKEIAYIIFAGAFAPILLAAHFDWRFTNRPVREVIEEYLPTSHALAAGLTFLGLLLFLFGGWPPNPLAAPGNILYGLETWLVKGQGGEADALFYVGTLINDTFWVFAFALVGCLGTYLRPQASLVRWMLVGWAAATGLIMSLVGHQWTWIFIDIAAPVMLLAGLGIYDAVIAATRAFAGMSRTPTVTSRHALVTLVTVVLVVSSLFVAPTVGVEGINQDDYGTDKRETFRAAVDLSERTGCSIKLVQDGGRFPEIWYLRNSNYTRISTYNHSDGPAIVIAPEQPAATNTTIAKGASEGYGIYRDRC